MNVIDIDGERLEVDLVRSGIRGRMTGDDTAVTISLCVEAVRTNLSRFEAVILNVAFVPGQFENGWTSLESCHFNVNCHTDEEALLPDEPATLYLGWHMKARNNKIEFGELREGGFRVKWTCQASDYGIALDSWLPIVGVDVNFPDLFEAAMKNVTEDSVEAIDRAVSTIEVNQDQALAVLSRIFDPSNYGSPARLRWGLRFPFNRR